MLHLKLLDLARMKLHPEVPDRKNHLLSKPGPDRKMNLLLDEKPEGQGMPKKIDRPQSEKQESLEETKKMDRHLNEKPKDPGVGKRRNRHQEERKNDPGVDKRDHRQKQRRGSPAGAIRKMDHPKVERLDDQGMSKRKVHMQEKPLAARVLKKAGLPDPTPALQPPREEPLETIPPLYCPRQPLVRAQGRHPVTLQAKSWLKGLTRTVWRRETGRKVAEKIGRILHSTQDLRNTSDSLPQLKRHLLMEERPEARMEKE